MESPTDNKSWMEAAIEEAKKASRAGEVPIGAVVVVDGTIVASAHNEVEQRHDATAHAEMLALQRASVHCRSWRLTNAKLFVTMEPCPMCIGAMLLSRVSELYFGCHDSRLGAAGSQFNLAEHSTLPHQIVTYSGLLAAESELLLKQFFSAKRA